MYPTLLTRLAAFCLFLSLLSCTTARVATVPPIPSFTLVETNAKTTNRQATISTANNRSTTNIASVNKNVASNNRFIGPPEYIPDPPPASAPKIIEKGGKYVYLPPAYAMRKPEIGSAQHSVESLNRKTKLIRDFAISSNYDSSVAFFIDMGVKSSRKRFLVVDLTTGQVIKEGMVAHGRGAEKFTFDRQYSNGEGSNCTSLGIYKIGKSYNGAFGLSYKLYGLNKTNNNALKRYVVLHAMNSIPDAEANWPIAQTEGCPAVSPDFLKELAYIIDTAPKNILLCIYDGRQVK